MKEGYMIRLKYLIRIVNRLYVRKLEKESNVTIIKCEPQIRENSEHLIPDIMYQKPIRRKPGVYPMTVTMDPTIKSTNKSLEEAHKKKL